MASKLKKLLIIGKTFVSSRRRQKNVQDRDPQKLTTNRAPKTLEYLKIVVSFNKKIRAIIIPQRSNRTKGTAILIKDQKPESVLDSPRKKFR